DVRYSPSHFRPPPLLLPCSPTARSEISTGCSSGRRQSSRYFAFRTGLWTIAPIAERDTTHDRQEGFEALTRRVAVPWHEGSKSPGRDHPDHAGGGEQGDHPQGGRPAGRRRRRGVAAYL